VSCFPLNSVTAALGVTHVDYLSLDVEGPELEILATVDWTRLRVDVITVEYRVRLRPPPRSGAAPGGSSQRSTGSDSAPGPVLPRWVVPARWVGHHGGVPRHGRQAPRHRRTGDAQEARRPTPVLQQYGRYESRFYTCTFRALDPADALN